MSHFSRLPVRFVAGNDELLKSQESMAKSVDHDDHPIDDVPTAHMEPQYRAPRDRNLGNVLFRRLPDGQLDMEAAKMVVIDMIHKAKDLSPLTEMEKLVLGCFFPLQFPFVDVRLASQITAVQLKLAPWEMAMVAQAVAAHLTAEMQYNAGHGGFPTPHPRA